MEQPTVSTIASPFVRWLDADTVLVLSGIGAAPEELVADERRYAAGMSRPRLREFAAGRAIARRALEGLQSPCATGIAMGDAGEPLWPRGICGSLSHTSTHVAALVTRSTRHASVGLDLDDERLLGSVAAGELMTDEEVRAVLLQDWTADVGIAQNIVFSAKEALFKYQYPLTRKGEVAFEEIRLTVERGQGLGVVCTQPDVLLQSVVAMARVFFDEIQGVRACWVLSTG